MDIMKIIGVAFITTIAAVLLKSTKPELSFAVTVTGVIVILLFIVDALENTLTVFTAKKHGRLCAIFSRHTDLM